MFLRQQLETALSKQENSSKAFCNNRNVQHVPSNIVNSDDSFIMTDYHTKAIGSDNNIQTDSYINNENTDNIIASPSTENSQEDHTSSYISKSTLSVNKKKIFILSDSMVKHIQGWDISSKLQNKHKAYVRSFLSAKVKSMKYYSKPCFKEDKPDHLIPCRTNDLSSENNAERIAKSIVGLAEGLVADNCTISVSSIVPRNDKLNRKVADVNSYLERMCSYLNIHFIDNTRFIN